MLNNSVTLTNVRLSYVHLLRPYAANLANPQPKFSCTILLPKSDVEGKAQLDDAIEAAKQAGLRTKFSGSIPAGLKSPIHDGDGLTEGGEKYGPECAGCWVITASSPADRPVEVVDRNMNQILDVSKVYSGIYANINVRMFAYSNEERSGIGCALGPVQKVNDGEPLGSLPPTAADCFKPLDDNDGNVFAYDQEDCPF